MTSDIINKYAQFQRQALPFMDKLYAWARFMTNSSTELDALIEETYAHAWQNFADLESKQNLQAHLFRIMIETYDRNRKKGVQYFRSEPTEVIQNSGGRKPMPKRLATVEPELTRALDHLPLRYRMLVLLSDVSGFGYREMALILNASIKTVKLRMCRARKVLAKLLKPLYGSA